MFKIRRQFPQKIIDMDQEVLPSRLLEAAGLCRNDAKVHQLVKRIGGRLMDRRGPEGWQSISPWSGLAGFFGQATRVPRINDCHISCLVGPSSHEPLSNRTSHQEYRPSASEARQRGIAAATTRGHLRATSTNQSIGIASRWVSLGCCTRPNTYYRQLSRWLSEGAPRRFLLILSGFLLLANAAIGYQGL